MTHQQLFTCFFLLILIPLSAKALPPPSPAGGGMLRLDEKHDFVATVETWFPDEEFEGLTAEAWIYFEEPPLPLSFWSIIGQEGRFRLILHGNAGALGASAYAEGANTVVIIGGRDQHPPKGEWVHVTAVYDAGAGIGTNGKGGNWCCPGGHLIKSNKPLRIGGIIPQEPWRLFVGENVKFRGYIDEVRISNIVRYVGPEWEVPKWKFEVDEHTISLWHFDEETGFNRFKDASGNGHHLWRGGVIGGLAVEAERKLTTTWGQLKR